MKRFLNIGGHDKTWKTHAALEGYQQVMLDIDPDSNADIICDARNLCSLTPGQFDAIYCSHTLEHFASSELEWVLEGFKHVLKPDGWVMVIVPDIVFCIRAMLTRGHDLLDVMYYVEGEPGQFMEIRYADVLYGHHGLLCTNHPYYKHHYGFSEKSLYACMSAHGFKGRIIHVGNESGDIMFVGGLV